MRRPKKTLKQRVRNTIAGGLATILSAMPISLPAQTFKELPNAPELETLAVREYDDITPHQGGGLLQKGSKLKFSTYKPKYKRIKSFYFDMESQDGCFHNSTNVGLIIDEFVKIERVHQRGNFIDWLMKNEWKNDGKDWRNQISESNAMRFAEAVTKTIAGDPLLSMGTSDFGRENLRFGTMVEEGCKFIQFNLENRDDYQARSIRIDYSINPRIRKLKNEFGEEISPKDYIPGAAMFIWRGQKGDFGGIHWIPFKQERVIEEGKEFEKEKLKNVVKAHITQNILYNIEAAIADYRLNTGAFPSQKEGLIALIKNPGKEGWKGSYLTTKIIPKDAWGQELIYAAPSPLTGWGENAMVFSKGMDRKKGTEDDIDICSNLNTYTN